MFTLNLLVGETKGVLATPKDAQGNPTINTGNAVCVGADDTIAKKTNNTGDGLTTNITGVAAGSVIFTVTGHKPDGTTEVSSQFMAHVTEPTDTSIDHFDFAEVAPI